MMRSSSNNNDDSSSVSSEEKNSVDKKKRRGSSNSGGGTTSIITKSEQSKSNKDAKKKKKKTVKKMTPLAVCPACDKVLASVRGLFGHYGVKHRTTIDQETIKFCCPFCSDDDDDDAEEEDREIFDTMDSLKSHVTKSHPGCELDDTLVYTNVASGSSSGKKRSSSSSTSQQQPTTSNETSERRKSSRTQEISDAKPAASSTNNVKQQYSHPLCQCPICPKVFPPTGLFGHFGRVHSGQLGHTIRFEWKNVSFMCPYCPENDDDEPRRTFRTIDLAQAHVSSHHPNCHLIKPNAMSSTPRQRSSSSNKMDTAADLSSSRKSQRSSSRLSSVEGGGEDDDEDDGDSPSGQQRKSQRSRRPVVDLYFSKNFPENQTVRGSAKQPSKPTTTTTSSSKRSSGVVVQVNEGEVKPLYHCPACDKTNLTKHGLHAHYGMKHGGSVDFSTVKMVNQKKKKSSGKKGSTSSRMGPWTDEEHEAFLKGFRKYGNRWKQISVEFVPTRDAKQIGSHALNYFTTKGEWHKVGGKPGWQDRQDLQSLKPTTGSMDIDDDDDDDNDDGAISMEEGSSDVEAVVERDVHDDDDGNSSHCIVCFEGGNIVCCSKCPRAYHPKCLAKDGQASYVNIELMPDDWSCNRCKRDVEITAGEEIPDYAFGNKKIRAAYAEFKDCKDYNSCCTLLSNILDILTKLRSHDYGYVYAEPVGLEDVPDYLEVVQTPMDYGTVNERLEEGKYIDLIGSDDTPRQDENSTMEDIVLHVLCDIERVHFNCRMYNSSGSSLTRIANVHATKWATYFNQYLLDRLPEKVQRGLTTFRLSCKEALEERKSPKKSKKKISASLSSSRKRKVVDQRSLELEEYYDDDDDEDEDEHAGEGDDDTDEEEGVQDKEQRPPKKSKFEEGSAGGLVFTEDQMRSLEHVFFSSPTQLRRDESDDSIDASSTLSPPPQGKPGTLSPKNDSGTPALTSELGGTLPEQVNSSRGPSDRPTKETDSSSPLGFYQKQWYDRLDEIKRYKISHGTAVVSATSNDSLYHWRVRQRKRYHLTLFRMPHLKKMDDNDAWGDGTSRNHDKQWLLTMPEMKGKFSISTSSQDGDGEDEEPKPFIISEKDVELDEETYDIIRCKHQEQLYYPPSLTPGGRDLQLPQAHSSRHSTSLFWDESLEELLFFNDMYGHSIVPRDFPYNSYLSLWVDIHRAKYLLQKIGLFSGLSGAQMLVLDELNICDLSSVATSNNKLKKDVRSRTRPNKLPPKSNGKGGKKSWSTRFNEFKEWFDDLPPEDKRNAGLLLPSLNWPLYSWCWRQCNAACAVLCEAPHIPKMKTLSVKRLKILSANGFFLAFNSKKRGGFVCEDEYEGSDAFDSTFQILEDFSMKYSSTLLPSWYDCDGAFRMWVAALENGLCSFVKGQPCVLSAKQIEQLILIGFCNDRDNLPNLSRSDVVWLKMFAELKRHQGLFGVCNVASDQFPRLYEWLAEQKELFLRSRMGSKDIMKPSRLNMLIEAGVDFYTGECMPGTCSMSCSNLKTFQLLTSAPAERFPDQGGFGSSENGLLNFQDDNYWNNQDCQAKYEHFKSKNGHSLILASDDIDVYWWFVEKRGNALLSEISSLNLGHQGCYETDGLYSNSILRYIQTEEGDKENEDEGETVEEVVDQSMFLWLHYYERLMMFKARMGHCKIPKNYPDTPLRQWLLQQQDLIYSYGNNHYVIVALKPVQIKLLHALGVHGCKREAILPKLSTRLLKRKHPLKKKETRQRIV